MSLGAGDRRFIALIDATLDEARRRAGAHLVCRPGCTECCIGPFPITRLDAWRLRRGLAVLAGRDPARAERVRERAREQWARLAPEFPGDVVGGVLADGEREEAFRERFSEVACPALDPSGGTCDVYEWRPVSCRTFGPPVILRGEPLPPCRLCFRTPEAEVIEAARVEFDFGSDEEGLIDVAETSSGRRGETLVAWCLAT